MKELIMDYGVPGIIALLAAFGVFKVVKNKMGEVKSLKDFIDFFLTDETVLQILNNIVSSMELDVKHYDKFEDFLIEYKWKAIQEFKSYLESRNIPDSILAFITNANIEKVIDTIMEKTNILEELEEIFNESVKAELEDGAANTEEVVEETVEGETTDTETVKEEPTTNIDLDQFYKE